MYFIGNSNPPVSKPQRIVSLVPSQTELLFDLGLEAETIGITKFCIHPESWFRSKQRIGGTKTIDIEKIKALSPDLIIANKEENVQEQVEALQDIAPVWVSDIHTFEDAMQMIRTVGELTFTSKKAVAIASQIEADFKRLEADLSHPKALYLIWKSPWMTVGKDTFISDLMKRAGLKNAYDDALRYPEITIADMQVRQPDLILLSSEPFPFKQQHIAELQSALPDAKVMLVDGEMFSWYGSRLLHSAAYLNQLQF